MEKKRVSSSNRKRTPEEMERIRQKRRKKKIQEEKMRRRRRRKRIRAIIFVILLLVVVLGISKVITSFSHANKASTKGMEAYEKGDYETAIGYFETAVEYDHRNSIYYVYLGMVQTELKLYEEAMESLNQALTLANQKSEIQQVHRAKGISYLYQGNYSEAIASFDEALAGKDKDLTAIEEDILFYKAETQDKSGNYVDSVLSYDILVNETNSADAHMLRGMEFVKVGNYTNAESDLREAIKKDKKNYEIYFTLYEVLKAQGKNDEAIEVLNEALKLGGSQGSALVSQGEIYMILGDFETAKEKFDKALKKKENRANLGLANWCMSQSPVDEENAKKYYEAYLESETTDAEAYNEYGLCLMSMEDYEKAEEIFTKGIALNDRLMDRSLSKNQIAAAEKAGHWENALEYINLYLTKYGDDTLAIQEKEFILTRVR